MFIKRKLVAGAAALTLVGGACMVAAAGTATAGTPSCGSRCINLFQARYGGVSGARGTFNPSAVIDVYKQRQAVNTPVIVFQASNADPAEDFTVANVGRVSEFYAAGLVSATLALHYGCELSSAGGPFPTCPYTVTFTDAAGVPHTVTPDLFAYEYEYAPFGSDSGLCIGVAATASPEEPVTLQPCGVSSKTIWVVDDLNVVDHATGQIEQVSPDPIGAFGVPLINGSDTNFSRPYVLTYEGDPSDKPRDPVRVYPLSGFSQQASGPFASDASLETVSDLQQWQWFVGVLP
jgi:hypothetical protein